MRFFMIVLVSFATPGVGLADTPPMQDQVKIKLVAAPDSSAVATPCAREIRSVVSGVCPPSSAAQSTTSRNTAGQYQLTISQGADTIWSMLVLRPSISTGTRSSGVELRDIFFRNKLVLGRAHVPIVTGEWPGGACGPYRFWQYQEGQFACAAGVDVAPGIRICAASPQTILESGSDTGAFRGVGLFTTGTSVDVVSELEAGWTRHVFRWTFDLDGTIRARVGFGNTNNSCSCLDHQRHAYFRFDVDMAEAANNAVLHRVGGAYVAYAAETMELRSGQRWRVQNSLTQERLDLIPGRDDGTAGSASAFGRGDFWALVNKSPLELDDGINITTGLQAPAAISNFVDAESLTPNSDIVLWYGVHHDSATSSDYLGPDLVFDLIFADGFQ